MRSSLTSVSRFLSTISVLAPLATLLALGACHDDPTCGTSGAPDSGLTASATDVTLTFGALVGGLNNDCPDPAAPVGVTSLSIAGTQTGGTGLFTICVPRPDNLAAGDLSLSIDAAGVPGSPTEVRIVDLTGDASNCTFKFDKTRPPTGTATAEGLCDNGANAAGFALVVDGAISLTRTCGATVDQVSVTLRGRVAVAADI